MGPIDCPETSVRNYHHSLRNRPKERSSNLPREGSSKSCKVLRKPSGILMRTQQFFSNCLLFRKKMLKENFPRTSDVCKLPRKLVYLEPFDLGTAFDILNCACDLPVGTVKNALQFLALCPSHVWNKTKVVGSMCLLKSQVMEVNAGVETQFHIT
jgi:hypothetical protein